MFRFSTLVMMLFASIAGLTTSCAFKKDSNSDSDKGQSETRNNSSPDVLSSSELSVDFIPLSSFGRYSARLSWPEQKRLQFSLKYAIEPKDPKSIFRTELIDTRTVRSFDIPCESDASTFPEVVFSYAAGVAPVTLRLNVKCPVDERISGLYTSFERLTSVTGRLLIENGAVLNLGPKKIDLNLIELVVQGNAVIASDRPLPKNDGSDDDKAEIRIRAKKATGTLTLKLSGGNAPDARSGRELQEASAEYKELLSKNPVSNGKAGEAGQSSLSSIGRGPDRLVTTKCTKQPTNGGKGEDGKVPGMAGEDASPGGPTSRLVVAIQDVSDFQLNILNTRGKPGKAGVGGPGQRGGAGGAAGASADSCSRASEGSAGKNAPDGPSGREADFGPCGLAKLSENLLDRRILRVVSEPQGDNCINERFVESLKIDEAVSSHR